jgi:hypothetical protein
MKEDYKPEINLKLNFKGTTKSIYHDLRHEIIDKLGSIDTLYIFKWQFGNFGTTYLDIFNFNLK